MKACVVDELVKSRMKCDGPIVRMKDEWVSTISETKKQAGCRKRGKPQLRWEDCLKRDIIEAEGKEKWRGARDKHNESSHRAERQMASHTPQGKREEEQ